MSEAKHTPGPWHASYTKLGLVHAENGAIVARCERLTSLTQLSANARLIAATPGLFSIASRLAALSDGLANGNSASEFAAVELASEARAFISKEMGAQS